jgi:DNA polymerase III sliding clamp (beta) subunit (PCNA family)
MTQFTINQNALDALLLIAGKKDIRHYLNGIYVEFDAKTTRIVGCDGHKLGIFQVASENNSGAGSIIIPRSTIESLPKKAGNLIFSIVEGNRWRIDAQNCAVFFTPEDAKYPDFRRVVSSIQTAGTSGAAAGFNLDYLNQFEKCGNLLAGSKLRMGNRLRLHHNGDAAALVLLNCVDGFAGVVMPLRDSIGSTGALFPLELTSDLTAGAMQPQAVAA